MKNSLKKLLLVIIATVTVFSLLSCDNIGESTTPATTTQPEAPQSGDPTSEESTADEIPAEGLWKDAIYRSDKAFGNGGTTVYVEVKVGDQSVTFTLKTDKETLGAALIDHSLIDGEQGAFGLYIKKVNGITADYDIDKSYWGFYQDGKYMMTGVDQTKITNGDHYELVYEK